MPKSEIKITAVARIAPTEFLGKEPIYTLKGNKEILLMDPRSVVVEHNFEFDQVFMPDSANSEIFLNCCRPMVEQVLDGCNGCCLAYGQRKAGKSLSIFGGEESQGEGMVQMALEMVLEAKRAAPGMQVTMSFVDIAQDKIRDLGRANLPDFLPSDPSTIQQFTHSELRLEEQIGGFTLLTATAFPLSSLSDAVSILRSGLSFRKSQESMLNPISLMHTFAIITIEREGDLTHPVSLLVFGDLARSEKARKDSVAVDQINAQHITSVHGSFVSLSRVLESLSKQTEDKDLIIPFKESKITALLSRCLNSACNFVLLACIHPLPGQFDDIVSVLQYAGKIKSLAQDGVVLSKDMLDEARLKDMRMKKLREDINDLKFQLEQFEFLHGKRLKELAQKLGLDFDLETLAVSDPYSREATAVRNLREAMEKADTLKQRKEEMEGRLDTQKEILAEVKLVAMSNQEKQTREMQEYQVQVNHLMSSIQTAQTDAAAGLDRGEIDRTEELQKLLYHGHLMIEEQSAAVNGLYRILESRGQAGEAYTEEREAGRNAVETSNRLNLRSSERDLKDSLHSEEEKFVHLIRDRSKAYMRAELDFRAFCREREEHIARYQGENVKLLQVIQQYHRLIEGIRSGEFNSGIVPVLIPKTHLPVVPDAIRFRQYAIIRDLFSLKSRRSLASPEAFSLQIPSRVF